MAAEALEVENRRNWLRLLRSIQASRQRLNLLIAICDNPAYQAELIQAYEAELQGKGFTCLRVTLNRTQPSLRQALAELAKQGDLGTAVVTVLGIDQLLSVRLQAEEQSDRDRFFFSLQWTREALREFRVPIVLWVTDPIATGLAQQAPDFWSWRGGVFEFDKPVLPMLAKRSVEDRPTPDYEPASPLLIEELEQQIATLKTQDPDSPLLASSLNNLAELYRSQGRYQAAEPLHQQALEMRRSLLGETHPDVATSLNNLALLYKLQGRYEAAEPLYIQALERFRSLLGDSHPHVATSLNNLAALYESQGRYEAAEPLFQQALEMSRSLLGDSHPDVATSLNNLALLYKSQGRYEDAEPLYQQALELRRSLLGENHPDVATSLNNLAGLYYSQGRYEAAEPLFQQALEMSRSLLGENHPDVASSLNNLAGLYAYMQRFDLAEALMLQALEMRQRLLGEQHPDTIRTRSSLENIRAVMNQQSHPQ